MTSLRGRIVSIDDLFPLATVAYDTDGGECLSTFALAAVEGYNGKKLKRLKDYGKHGFRVGTYVRIEMNDRYVVTTVRPK
jgi:hypothetical protein